MTTVTGYAPSTRNAAPSVLAQRARRLLVAGLLAGHAAALVCAGVALVFGGVPALVSAAFGAMLVLLFNTLGLTVQIIFADADAWTVMGASLASFVVRAAAFVAVLAAFFNLAGDATRLVPAAFVLTAAITLVAWLAAEVRTLAQLRITNFDEPARGTASGDARHVGGSEVSK